MIVVLSPVYARSAQEEKRNICNILVDSVLSVGGRFLARDRDGEWHQIDEERNHTCALMVNSKSSKSSITQYIIYVYITITFFMP